MNKKLTRGALALLSCVGIVVGLAAPAVAATQAAQSWKIMDSNGGCAYSYASVDGTDALPGTAKVFSSGMTIYREQTPCTFGQNTSQHLAADTLLVRVTLHCRTIDGAGNLGSDYVAWQSDQVGNANGTGKVSVSYAGIDGSGTLFPCRGDVGLGVQARTTVRSWVWLGFAYGDGGTKSTAWVDAD